MTPTVRTIRTLVQVFIGLAAGVPLLVALLAALGIEVDGRQWAAVAAAAVALVSFVWNTLERLGILPELGAPKAQ